MLTLLNYPPPIHTVLPWSLSLFWLHPGWSICEACTNLNRRVIVVIVRQLCRELSYHLALFLRLAIKAQDSRYYWPSIPIADSILHILQDVDWGVVWRPHSILCLPVELLAIFGPFLSFCCVELRTDSVNQIPSYQLRSWVFQMNADNLRNTNHVISNVCMQSCSTSI